MSLAEGITAAKEVAIALSTLPLVVNFFDDGDDGDDDGDGGLDTPKTQPPTRVHSGK